MTNHSRSWRSGSFFNQDLEHTYYHHVENCIVFRSFIYFADYFIVLVLKIQSVFYCFVLSYRSKKGYFSSPPRLKIDDDSRPEDEPIENLLDLADKETASSGTFSKRKDIFNR